MIITLQNLFYLLEKRQYILSGTRDGKRYYLPIEGAIEELERSPIWGGEHIKTCWTGQNCVITEPEEKPDRATVVLLDRATLVRYPVEKQFSISRHAAEIARIHENWIKDGQRDRQRLLKFAEEFIRDEELSIVGVSPYHSWTDNEEVYISIFTPIYAEYYIRCVERREGL